jgi:zinc transport system ATP-binding protein
VKDERTLICLERVEFRYRRDPVLVDIDLEILSGDFLAVIGPNGSGKTSLIKIMLGLLEPVRGSVSLFGIPIRDFREWERVGYVPQKATHFDPYFPASVREVVAMGLVSRGNRRRFRSGERESRVLGALEAVGMGDKKDSPIGELSGGQQQRVFIARALVSSPEILVLDEPTAGVDAASQNRFYGMLDRLNRETGLTVVFSTHNVGVVTKHVNKVACVNQRLFFHGSHDEFCETDHLLEAVGGRAHIISHEH